MGQPRTGHSHGEIDAEQAHRSVSTRLARDDQRYTAGRRRLVDLLLAIGRPATLPELAEADPSIPTSSMYRNLEVLERLGLVQRITTGADHAHFELSEPLVGHHHHLICVACGRVDDVELDTELESMVEATLENAARDVGFQPLHHTLDLHGHCPDCAD